MKKLAMLNKRLRIRLCTHVSPNDKLHEMFIIHAKDCYVRPHKHIGRVESMAIIEGEADLVLFDEDGIIKQVISMGEISSGKKFYYRLSEPVYHTLLIRTDFLVFHEITEGPFSRENSFFPEWAPEEYDTDFIEHIESRINSWR